MAVTANGRLFGWGFNKYGQLGVGHTQACPEPQQVLTFQDVDGAQLQLSGDIQLLCGWWWTICFVQDLPLHAVVTVH